MQGKARRAFAHAQSMTSRHRTVFAGASLACVFLTGRAHTIGRNARVPGGVAVMGLLAFS